MAGDSETTVDMVEKFKRLHEALRCIMLIADVGRNRNPNQMSADIYTCYVYARDAIAKEFPLPREWMS